MKIRILPLLAAATVLGATPLASAATLLTDDFTVTTGSSDPNFEIENRQGGSQALSFYTVRNGNGSGNGVQLGNTVTDVGQPGFPDNGNFLLLADNYAVQNDLLIFNDGVFATAPLNFTFDLYVKSQGADQTVWSSFTLRAPGDGFVIAGAGEFGMLRRANGGMQFFTDGGAFLELDPGTSMSSLFSVTFTDAAGTGSAFTGNGSRVFVINDGNMVLDHTFATDLSAGGLNAGWGAMAGAVGGLDNLVISAVPEPSTIASLAIGGLGLVLLARKRRRAAV